MPYSLTKRYAHWSPLNYGSETPLGVISKSSLLLDGSESSHLGCGWHDIEEGFRWTKKQAIAFLHRSRGQDVLELELSSGPEQFGPVSVTVEAGEHN